MIVEKGKKIILVRYSDFLYKNCMNDHLSVLEKNGYCWFGKVGKQKPSEKFAGLVMSEERPLIILHSKNDAYICDLAEVSYERPVDGIYPQYYEDVLFKQNNNPSAYFKITSLIKIEKGVLSNFIVSSSRNELPVALKGSMNSIFLVENVKEVLIEEK